MQIVIDVPDEDYKRIKDMPDAFNSLTSRAYKSIKNGTPLPEGHGRLIDADAVNVNETIGGKNEFADCIREAVQTTLDNAPTVIEADKEAENESD